MLAVLKYGRGAAVRGAADPPEIRAHENRDPELPSQPSWAAQAEEIRRRCLRREKLGPNS